MSDEKIRYAYRICPCFSYDIEGIQTWLEDMAAQGMVLEADGTFLGVFTFQKTTPKQCLYRLAPVKQKQGFFSDFTDAPNEEEQEFSEKCGWEYLVRYGSFYIYRATSSNARPLHTDPTVHAMALENLKKQKRSTVLSMVINFIIYSVLTHNAFSFFRSGATIGLIFLLSLIAYGLWLVSGAAITIKQLSHYQKRLQSGDPLDNGKNWKQRAPVTRCTKLIPWVIVLVFFVSWAIALNAASNKIPLDQYLGDPPFAVLEDVFPEAEIDRGANFGDYNTVIHYSTSLAENYEWNQEDTVLSDAGSYHCILRIDHHKTIGKFWAKGLFHDYYMYERLRYRGKRFEELDAPETGFDQVRIFSSYGILHILVQHENTVTHAVVSITQQGQNNQWQLWLETMEDKLLH